MAFFGLFKLKHLAVTGCTRSLLSNPTFRVGREKRGGPPKNFFDFFFNIWILEAKKMTARAVRSAVFF